MCIRDRNVSVRFTGLLAHRFEDVIQDQVLGELTLDKDYDAFEGEIQWCGKDAVSYTHLVYETYSPLLDTPQKGYLFHALGMLHYRCYPEGWTYERLGPDGMIALIFWGDYSYGTYDTRFMIERYVDLDERWLFDLAKDPEGRKPTVTWQTYNRGGVLYGSYDEMFISLLPLKVENPELKRVLWDYFRIRSQKKKVAKSITVYKDAAERFGDE